MPREDFSDLLVFLAVAEERSFTKAAVRLGLTQSTVSHTVRRLETRLGLRLLTRTTRNVATTEIGEKLVASLQPRIEGIEADLSALLEYRDRPAGTVRLTVSDHALHGFIWPQLCEALRRHPDVKVEFDSDNGFRDIVEGRYDAGIRLGESLEKDMIAVRVSPDWRLVAVASPGYLEAHGAPLKPQDLLHHKCINLRLLGSGGIYAWEFEKDGQELRVRVEGQLTFNSVFPVIEAAIDGFGICYVPDNLVAEHIAAGRLALMLDEWSPYFAGYHIYYPSRRQVPSALSVVINALRQR